MSDISTALQTVNFTQVKIDPLVQQALHKYILEQMEDDGVLFDAEALEKDNILLPIQSYIQQYAQRFGLSQDFPVDEFAHQLINEMIGFGPIESLLQDPSVDDILINGPENVYVERGGKLERVDHHFINNEHIIRMIRRMLAPLGRRVDESNPMVDARLPDGSRINAIIPPLALNGACLSIRKFKKEALSEDDLIAHGAMSTEMKDFLKQSVKARFNVLISGATGSGKTTLLNILSQHINLQERVVTIEDAAELQLRNGHVVSLETRPPNSEGNGEVTARQLLKNALRMRPDRIILGESRGGEVLDMLQAMNTGHLGSMSTLHANSPMDALVRLEMMVTLSGFNSSETFIQKLVASAIDVIIQVSRLSSGQRLITEIVEVMNVDSQHIQISPLFHYESSSKQFLSNAELSPRLKLQWEESL